MHRRNFIYSLALSVTAGVATPWKSALTAQPISPRGAGTGYSIEGEGAYALAPIADFVRKNGLLETAPENPDAATLVYSLVEWKQANRKSPPTCGEYGTLRIQYKRQPDGAEYQLARMEQMVESTALVRRNGNSLSWEFEQKPRGKESMDLGLSTRVRGEAGNGLWRQSINGREESGNLEHHPVADCELLTGGVPLSKLAQSGPATLFSHEFCFQHPAPCEVSQNEPLTLRGQTENLSLAVYSLSCAHRLPQHYLVPTGQQYSTACTEFATSFILKQIA
ncbi:hypothetical protein H5P28_04250 [Ruficoccus amylovorans]|uniref:Uncharacterized protein n=1 Tax=Ruficoccus amylovorans TaxID=1804625 RepID=A0A842HCP6_9BACT|nr:hypothetical protein [Ruficoccus amylovorans]MBC2593466.1 hypothetical protein [Ruficoccus amylovorans]